MNRAERLRIPAEIALAALLAYWLGSWFTSLFPGYLPKIGGLWSAISAIVVTQATSKEALSSASLRILGSAIGAATSAVYLTLLPFHPAGMAVAIFATVLLCAAVNVPSHPASRSRCRGQSTMLKTMITVLPAAAASEKKSRTAASLYFC